MARTMAEVRESTVGRHRAANARKQFLIRLGVLCARRNYKIFAQLAYPKAGGRPPKPPRIEYDE